MLGLDPQALPKVVDTRATISYKAYHAGLACMLQRAFFSKKARGMAEPIEGLFVLGPRLPRPQVCVESLSLQLRVGPPVKGVGREGMIIKLQLGWEDKVMCYITGDEFKAHQGKQGGFSIPERHATTIEDWLQWRNKGTMVKESVTARFHGFRMKAAAAVEHIDEGRTCRGGDARRRRALPRGGPRSASSGSQPYVATTSATWSQAPRG
eukprot:g80764.t1